MGVEYGHFLVVNDDAWLPLPDTATRVEAVVRSWSLGDRPKRVVNLANGRNEQITGTTASVDPGPGVAFLYGGVQGLPVERIAGPSLYACRPAERYTMRTWLVLGTDYRVHWSSESIYFQLVSPPLAGHRPVEANVEEPFETLFVEGVHVLPAGEFVAQLSDAFRGPIVQVGEIYRDRQSPAEGMESLLERRIFTHVLRIMGAISATPPRNRHEALRGIPSARSPDTFGESCDKWQRTAPFV